MRNGKRRPGDQEDDGPSLTPDIDFDEGLDPNLNIGSGLGIDLEDGSLTIGLGGGLKIDTDGDGLKFGF